MRRHRTLFTGLALAVLIGFLVAVPAAVQAAAGSTTSSRARRGLDPAERKRLVNEIEKIVLENVYYVSGLWWRRSVVHWAKVKNYVAPPNHYSNQKLQDVWLAED